MSKKTVLYMVQNILSAMNSDEVNSISDTVESLQVAEVVRETYEDLVATLSIPERQSLVQLESLANVNSPNYLKIPARVKNISWIRYNNILINYLTPEQFIERMLRTPAPSMTTVDPASGISYAVPTNADPQYSTSFDDTYIAFDSINLGSDTVLQTSKSMAWADISNEFLMEDGFIPDLDEDMFPMLIAEAKNTCFVNFKQTANSNEQMRARRGLTRWQNETHKPPTGNPADRLPDYGRRR